MRGTVSFDVLNVKIGLTDSAVGPNFVAMATGSVEEKCNWQHMMAHFRKPPICAKILQKFLTLAEL